MFKDLMNKITRNKLSRFNNRTIFVHNLGGFDGIFIHKALVEIYGTKITCLLDDSNKYVSITYKGEVIDTSKGVKLTEAQLKENKYTIEFKDSCRLFPVSLDLLCKVFKVEGKASKYNPLYNDVNLFDNLELLKTFKEYALQDTYSLRSALIKARSVYAGDWDVDIIKNFSNSGLSLKIYRHKFMESCKDYISVLTKPQDAIVRKSYFGGATDYYKSYGENLHYYDVNSLYPHAMNKLMPYAVDELISVDVTFNLNNFFGFLEVDVICPDTVKIPLLPLKVSGKTIYPRGSWRWTYFSEELKEVIKHGYIVTPVIGTEALAMKGAYIFKEYIDAFYAIKATAGKDSPERWIAKMHLNSLYGIFGRATEMKMTKLVERDDMVKELMSKTITSFIDITDKYQLISYVANMDTQLLKDLQVKFVNVEDHKASVMNNSAIASAVTAYGRIEMMQFKVGDLADHIYYTDTDSIFTDIQLPDHMIGSELGLMKDELDGAVIDRAHFLGIKRYAYQYKGATKTTFSGLQKNDLSWSDVESLVSGETVSRSYPNCFFKSMQDMSITIKPRNVSVRCGTDKPLMPKAEFTIP